MLNNQLIDLLSFDEFKINQRGETITSVDRDRKYLIKIQVKENPKKQRTLKEEFEIIQFLNNKKCISCPTAYEFGNVKSTNILEKIKSLAGSDYFPDKDYSYIIEQFVDNNGRYNLADIIFSMIEQKNLGVYQGDIKPANIMFDEKTGVCTFIDYDQAIFLDQKTSHMNTRSFLDWCSDYDKEKYGVGNWLRHFWEFDNDDVAALLKDGALDLAKTTLFKSQRTTNSASGIYHTIESRDVFAVGSRGLDGRTQILDLANFFPGEKVLDIGCNAGLLCEYLHARGCNVTGVDNDPHIVIAAKMIANSSQKDIDYYCMDLDYASSLEKFDTIMLFSVFHHTRNPANNAKKISESCNRIIIETRLVENGKQPEGSSWIDTTKWSFESLDSLTSFLESMFSGFKFERNLGFVDKGRYILEFLKR